MFVRYKNLFLLDTLLAFIVFVVSAAAEGVTFTVDSENQLYKALNIANTNNRADVIQLAPGFYTIHNRLKFIEPNTQLISTSNTSSSVVLSGKGMKPSHVAEVLIDIQADNITISGITLQNVSNHLIQVRSEKDADNFVLTNCVLKDAYEQLLKVSSSKNTDFYSDNGLVENCVFEYSKGIGPQYYIGGIDAHRSRNWVIKNNVFKSIASPAKRVAEHAVHIWKDSSGTQVVNNTFINNDRGVGFGLGTELPQHTGGVIQDNVFIHTASNHPYADASIILESAPNARVVDNSIIQLHNYPNAIEYRFKTTQNVEIKNNKANKRIKARDGGKAELVNNSRLQ